MGGLFIDLIKPTYLLYSLLWVRYSRELLKGGGFFSEKEGAARLARIGVLTFLAEILSESRGFSTGALLPNHRPLHRFLFQSFSLQT